MADGAATCPACGKSAAFSAGGGAAAASAQSSGLSDNVAGLLAYVTFIPAVIFLLIEPYSQNRTLRFHSFQSIFLAVASIVLQVALTMIPIIGWTLLPFVGLAIFVMAVVAAIKAYQGQKWKIPVIGDLAEKQANS